jgi:hypothetical protein
MQPGSDVEVRSRFDGKWVGGFQVAELGGPTGNERVRIRRRSDGSVLPAVFTAAEVRDPPTLPTMAP